MWNALAGNQAELPGATRRVAGSAVAVVDIEHTDRRVRDGMEGGVLVLLYNDV